MQAEVAVGPWGRGVSCAAAALDDVDLVLGDGGQQLVRPRDCSPVLASPASTTGKRARSRHGPSNQHHLIEEDEQRGPGGVQHRTTTANPTEIPTTSVPTANPTSSGGVRARGGRGAGRWVPVSRFSGWGVFSVSERILAESWSK